MGRLSCETSRHGHLMLFDDDEQLEALNLRAQLRGFELPPETARYLQRRFPRDMRTRCGLAAGAFPTVTVDYAMSEHGGWAAARGAVCLGCAVWPVAIICEERMA